MTTTLDWYGCATFRLRTAGLTIFLDAYIDRVAGASGTGLTADAIDVCDWVVVGHSHFDHLWGAERILRNTAARLIGSYETVRVMETAGIDVGRMITVAGGETVDLGHGVRVTAYPSQHSCVWSQGQLAPADQVCVADLGLTLQEQHARFAQLAAPDGTLLYQDTSGHWSGILRELRPDVAILAVAGRGNIDGPPRTELLGVGYLAGTPLFVR